MVASITIVFVLLFIGLLARIIRAITSSDKPTPSGRARPRRTFRACPGCDARVFFSDDICRECGLRLDSPTASRLNRLRITMDELEALQEAGTLDAVALEPVRAAVETQRETLQRPARSAPRPQRSGPPPLPVTLATATSATPPLERVANEAPPPVTPPPLPATSATPPPPRPRRTFGVMLGQFMHERNILWGELLGGLLIVGCSVALVLSLWRTLEELPYFTFALFAGITIAVFGAGEYTLHHWKLTATSRGLLLIALLLTPLNLLLLADPGSRGNTDAIDLVVKVLTVGGFAWLVRTAGRDLVGIDDLRGWVPRRWLLALAIVGTVAIPMLPITGEAAFYVPLWGPFICAAFATGPTVRRLSREYRTTEARPLPPTIASAVLLFVGLALFALFAAWAYQLTRADDLTAALHRIAGPLAFVGVPLLSAGLLVQRKLPEPIGLKIVGTVTALVGIVLSLFSVALAWPDPRLLLFVASSLAVVLAWMAYRDDLPWLHGFALPCGVLAVLLVRVLFDLPADERDASGWLADHLFGGGQGLPLAFTALALFALSERLRRTREAHAWPHVLMAGIVAVLSVTLASLRGLDAYPLQSTLVYDVLAVGTILAAWRRPSRTLCEIGVWLLLPGTLSLLKALQAPYTTWAVTLAGVGLLLGVAALGVRPRGRFWRQLAAALRNVSAGACIASVAFVMEPLGRGSEPRWPQSMTFFVVSVTTLLLAWLYRQRGLIGMAALVLGIACSHLLASTVAVEPLRLAYLLAFLLAAAVLLLATIGVRRWPSVRDFFGEPVRWCAQVLALPGVVLLFLPLETHLRTWALVSVGYAGVWFLVRALYGQRFSFALGQTLLARGTVVLGAAWCQSQAWFPSAPFVWLEPQCVQAYLLAIGVYALVLLLIQRVTRVANVWNDFPDVSRVLSYGMLIGAFILPLTQLIPSVMNEMTSRTAPPAFAVLPLFDWAWLPWLLLGVGGMLVLLLLRFGVVEAERRWLFITGGIVTLTVPLLFAGQFVADVAAATALRFGLAFFVVAGALVHGTRRALCAWLATRGLPLPTSKQALQDARVLWLLAAGVVVGLSVWLAQLGFAGVTPSGPFEGTLFAQLGVFATTLAPLVCVVLALAGTAYRERSPLFALAASLLATATVGGGYALSLVLAKQPLNPNVAVFSLLASALSSLAWLAVAKRIPDRGARSKLVLLSVGGLFVCLVMLAGLLRVEPSWNPDALYRGVGSHGWYTLALVLLAAKWHERKNQFTAFLAGVGVFGVGVLAAYTVSFWAEAPAWFAVRVLGLTWCCGLAGLVLFFWKQHDDRARASLSIDILGGVLAWYAVVVTWHAEANEAWTPYFPIGLLGVGAAAMLVLANRRQTLWRDYLAAGYLVLASGCAWVTWGDAAWLNMGLYLAVGMGVAVLAGTFRTARPKELPPMAHALAMFGLLALWLALTPTLAGNADTSHMLAWSAAATMAFAFCVLHFDRTAAHANAGLYVVGALLVGLLVQHTRGGNVWFDPLTPVALAGYTLAAVFAVWLFLKKSGVREWFLIATGVGTLVIFLMSVRTALHEETLSLRLIGAGALAVLVPATLLLAPRANTFAPLVRLATLLLGVLVCGVFGWAVPEPDSAVPWLQRHSWLFVALAVAVVVYSVVLPRLLVRERWEGALRRGSGLVFATALVVLTMLLVQQVPQYDPLTKRTPLTLDAVYAGLLGLFLMLGLSLRFALRSASDPLGPTMHGRTGYVYLAELLFVGVFIIIKLNLPGLFSANAVRYWTFTVMVIAFVGVGTAELCARRHLRVLAVPLLRTGALLPLIPLLAFWAKPPGFVLNFADDHAAGLRPMLGYLEKLPQHYDAYAALWFLAGLLYGLLALSRRSFGWALIGALATNAGLWCMLTYHQVPAIVHPQAWAIPLALIILIAEHVHRAKLRAATAMSLRYAGISMIYLSSAADMFIAGVGQSVWLPVVLATLCVLGVLLGMMLRVRAFLYLGSGFLMLDIFAMIWHAAVDRAQTWVWYVSGIVLGAIIIAVFAVLEKRRNSVVGLVERLRTWQS